MVGMEIHRGCYRLAKKSLKNWLGSALPTTLKELQGLLGKLLWASPFIANYKELVSPIEKLLSPKSGGEWSEECTDALNQALREIEKRLAVWIADPDLPLKRACGSDSHHWHGNLKPGGPRGEQDRGFSQQEPDFV
jgi:hypothetical protein